MMSRVGAVVAAEEVVEAHFVQRRRRRKGRNVAANALVRLVRAHDHRRRVPPNEALDAALEFPAAGHERFVVGGDGVDVGGVGGKRNLYAVLGGVLAQIPQQALHFDGPAALQHII